MDFFKTGAMEKPTKTCCIPRLVLSFNFGAWLQKNDENLVGTMMYKRDAVTYLLLWHGNEGCRINSLLVDRVSGTAKKAEL